MQLDPGGEAAPNAQGHVIFVIVPRFNLTTLITMIEAMRIANYLLPARAYSWEVASFDGPRITASNGMAVTTNADTGSIATGDLICVLGSWGAEHYDNRALIGWLRKRARLGARICAVELGCYIVARAGLLQGRTATTHWSWLSGFEERFPDTDVVEQLYTMDQRVLTCAGGLAGVDLMLRLIEESHGAGLAGEVADQMMHHPIRADSAPQRHLAGRSTDAMAPVVRRTIELIERSMTEPPSVPDIARTLGLSQRQLERKFKTHIGCSVVQFGLLLRLQHARVLLISTPLSVRDVATASGFNTLSHFAFAFRKCFGRRPSDYREGWPRDQATPTWPGTLSEFLSDLQKKNRQKGS
ncbi:GlxA family transcriptional regulator [Roseovarius sp. M141]|uniref:GlxA family transcriptional regulator n=1 Tax=Roseovarius sp. M141 TaxID=2583806 RepID=UPI0020CCCAC9|nr:GlxA family transcriptional regulator [Roseovarius sp. M141]MCQ0091612.1 GlxA family transcriptional regulator [Roseovarius sp. M141]